MNHIGELNEQALHAALKKLYAKPGDEVEVSVGGYVIDIVQGELLVEIQTGNFSSLKGKLRSLVKDHPVKLIYPVAREKWILKLPREGEDAPQRRKSPKRGRVEDVFSQLVSFPDLLRGDNFSLEVVIIQEEEVRHYTGKGWRKRGWKTIERRLLDVLERRTFETPADMGELLPLELPQAFTTADLAKGLDAPMRLAQQMAYCLRAMGEIVQIGKKGRAYLYERNA